MLYSSAQAVILIRAGLCFEEIGLMPVASGRRDPPKQKQVLLATPNANSGSPCEMVKIPFACHPPNTALMGRFQDEPMDLPLPNGNS